MLIKLKCNPNYYPSVARVDSSLIESTCIFLETLKKIQVKKIKYWFQTTHNKDIYQWRTHKHKSISNLKQETTTKKNTPPNMNNPIKVKPKWQELKR